MKDDDGPSPIHAPSKGDSPPDAFSGRRQTLPSPTGTLPMPGELRPEDVGICKFFLRGSCTWGETCKFLHPRGPPPPPPPERMNMVREPPPMINRPFPPPSLRGRGSFQSPALRGRGGYPNPFPPYQAPPGKPPPRQEPPEDAWERGLKQAREVSPLNAWGSQWGKLKGCKMG